MEAAILVAIIGAAGSVVLAATTFFLNARNAAKERLAQRKLERYTELMTAISDLAVKGFSEETNARYATAANTIVLTAPQAVVDALLRFQEEIMVSNANRTKEEHDALLSQLILEMRRSLELPFRDDPASFQFRLVGPGPSSSSAR